MVAQTSRPSAARSGVKCPTKIISIYVTCFENTIRVHEVRDDASRQKKYDFDQKIRRKKIKKKIWKIIEYVISKGDSFTFAPDASRELALEDWCSSEKHTFVAVDENEKILGTF